MIGLTVVILTVVLVSLFVGWFFLAEKISLWLGFDYLSLGMFFIIFLPIIVAIGIVIELALGAVEAKTPSNLPCEPLSEPVEVSQLLG